VRFEDRVLKYLFIFTSELYICETSSEKIRSIRFESRIRKLVIFSTREDKLRMLTTRACHPTYSCAWYTSTSDMIS